MTGPENRPTVTDPPVSGDPRGTGPVNLPVGLPIDAGSGSAAAPAPDFDAIYAEYFPFVWRCLRGLGVAESGLDDAAQDVFVVVHRRFAEFRGSSSIRTWLYGIVRNVASNHRRSLARKGHVLPLDREPPSLAPGPAEAAEHAEAAAFLERFLAELDAKKREVFMLR
ncbi:MAG TPA: sigma-70 family RNA polymerase sigma factor, partial [Polyangiaceae bacterium]|nr:sigma-70 family RNA polymerase sigma factor [Polyangiaceae bacterium]